MQLFSFRKAYSIVVLSLVALSVGVFIVPGLYNEHIFSLRGRHTVLLSIILLSLIAGVVITFIIKWIHEARTGTLTPAVESKELSPEELSKYRGLGGWMIFVILSLILGISLDCISFFGSISGYFLGVYSDSSMRFMWDVFSAGFLLIASLYVAFLLFKKKKKFPNAALLLFALTSVVNAFDYWLVMSHDEPPEFTAMFMNKIVTRSVLWLIVLYFYMKKSKRVRATFINE